MDKWTTTLPSYFQIGIVPSCHHRWFLFARARIWWRFWNLKIIVFRHILLRRAILERSQAPNQAAQSMADIDECQRICVDAARSTIVSISQYSESVLTRLEGWYAT